MREGERKGEGKVSLTKIQEREDPAGWVEERNINQLDTRTQRTADITHNTQTTRNTNTPLDHNNQTGANSNNHDFVDCFPRGPHTLWGIRVLHLLIFENTSKRHISSIVVRA